MAATGPAATDTHIPLMDACLRLRLSYAACRDRVLRGDLEGRRDSLGRWMVSERSVREAEQRIATRTGNPTDVGGAEALPSTSTRRRAQS